MKMTQKHTGIIFIFLLLLTLTLPIFCLFFQSEVLAQTSTIVALDPIKFDLTQINQVFEVNITVQNVQNLWQWSTMVTWDPNVLNIVGNPLEGDFMKTNNNQDLDTLFVAAPVNATSKLYDNAAGTLPEVSCTLLGDGSASGNGVLATLKFKIIKPAVESRINLVNTYLNLQEQDATSPTTMKLIAHQTLTPALVTLLAGDAPIASAGDPQTVNEDVPVTFNASKTIAKENSSYIWTFEDHNGSKTLDGINPSYTFDYPGIYNFTLTVTNGPLQSSDCTMITVIDTTPPIAKLKIGPSSNLDKLYAEHSIDFSGSGSYDPEGGRIANYQWDFGDGTPSNSIGYETANHIFANRGTYNVTLSVIDARSNLKATDFLVLTIQPASAFQSYDDKQTQSLTLPPTITGSIIVVTLITIAGSAFWLLGISKKSLRKSIN
jgi:PKD repeat protein